MPWWIIVEAASAYDGGLSYRIIVGAVSVHGCNWSLNGFRAAHGRPVGIRRPIADRLGFERLLNKAPAFIDPRQTSLSAPNPPFPDEFAQNHSCTCTEASSRSATYLATCKQLAIDSLAHCVDKQGLRRPGSKTNEPVSEHWCFCANRPPN